MLILGICECVGFASCSDKLDLMTMQLLIYSLFRILVNLCCISVYLASNLVIDLIHLDTALDILYVLFYCFKYVCFFPFLKITLLNIE